MFEIGLRHLSHFIAGGFLAVLHASVYSIHPSIAEELGFSFIEHYTTTFDLIASLQFDFLLELTAGKY